MKNNLTLRPRNIFLASVVLLVVYAALLPLIGDNAISAGIDIAGVIFLVWSVVAGVQAAMKTAKAKKVGVPPAGQAR